jgi:hypothetical protein
MKQRQFYSLYFRRTVFIIQANLRDLGFPDLLTLRQVTGKNKQQKNKL